MRGVSHLVPRVEVRLGLSGSWVLTISLAEAMNLLLAGNKSFWGFPLPLDLICRPKQHPRIKCDLGKIFPILNIWFVKKL
jgi:hypothetical protein